MSPRAMRRYHAPTLYCFACKGPIRFETLMIAGELFHPLCAAGLRETWGRPSAINAIAGESGPQRDVTRAQRGVR